MKEKNTGMKKMTQKIMIFLVVMICVGMISAVTTTAVTNDKTPTTTNQAENKRNVTKTTVNKNNRHITNRFINPNFVQIYAFLQQDDCPETKITKKMDKHFRNNKRTSKGKR